MKALLSRRVFSLALASACVLVSPAARGGEQPLTLTRALQLVKARAPSLRLARARRASADANVAEQRAAYYPSLSASITGAGSAVRDTEPSPLPGQALFAYSTYSGAAAGQGSLRWTLLDFGRTGNAVEAASRATTSAGQAVRTTELQLLSDGATAYLLLYYRERLREEARVTLEQREKLAALAEGLVRAGMQPALEDIRARARMDAARLQLSTADADVTDARIALAALVGVPPGELGPILQPHLGAAGAIAEGAVPRIESLPVVLSARAEYEAKKALADAASARYRPTVALSIDGQYTFTRYKGEDVLRNTRSAIGSLAVSAPIFDATIAPAVAVARAEASAAAAVLAETLRDARSEATRAIAAVRAGRGALADARSAKESAYSVLQIVQSRYAQGLSSPIELIDAEGAEAEARASLIRAELAYATAVVRALHATGRAPFEGET